MGEFYQLAPASLCRNKELCAAGPLCSAGVTPLQRYYGPSRHRLVFSRFPGANTDTKLLIYGLFQKGRVLAQDAHRKRGETDRPRLRSTAPALDPTGNEKKSGPRERTRALGKYVA